MQVDRVPRNRRLLAPETVNTLLTRVADLRRHRQLVCADFVRVAERHARTMDMDSSAERGVGSLPPLAGAVSGLPRTGRKSSVATSKVGVCVRFAVWFRVRECKFTCESTARGSSRSP